MQKIEDVELVSVLTLARIYEVHPATIWRYVKAGIIPQPIKVGKLTRWRMSEIRTAVKDAEAA